MHLNMSYIASIGKLYGDGGKTPDFEPGIEKGETHVSPS